MTNLEKRILSIIGSYKSYRTQYEITTECNLLNNLFIGEKDISCRMVRKVIAELIRQGYPIISNPKYGGGYRLQYDEQEGLECYRRIRRQAIRLFLKARYIKKNCLTKQIVMF
jgi:hypothetical protein